MTIWGNAGSHIRKFAHGCLKTFRTTAVRAALIEGRANVDHAHIKITEDVLGKAGMVMGYATYAQLLLSYGNIQLEVASMRRRVKRHPDNGDLKDKLVALRKRQKNLLNDLGKKSAFLGLGVGGMICQTLVLKGVRAAPYVGQIIKGVETFLLLGDKLHGLGAKVKKNQTRKLDKATQEQRIRDLYQKHRFNLDPELKRAAGMLRDARFVKVHKKFEFSRYAFATDAIRYLSLLVSSASTAIAIAGAFGAVAASVALGPLNIATLALLGISLVAIALRWIHANHYSWKLNLQAMITDWRIDKKEEIQSDLKQSIKLLQEQSELTESRSPADALTPEQLEQKLECINAELLRLKGRKIELTDAKMGEIFRKKFGEHFDLQSVEMLKDAALDLRNNAEGVKYLQEFFSLFDKTLYPAQLKSNQALTIEGMGALLRELQPLQAKLLMQRTFDSNQQKEILRGNQTPFASLDTHALHAMRAQLQIERERLSRISFLEKFGSLFVTA